MVGSALSHDVPGPAGFDRELHEVASAAGPTWSTVLTPADNRRLRIGRSAASTLGCGQRPLLVIGMRDVP